MSVIYCEFCDRRVDTDYEVEGREADGVYQCERCVEKATDPTYKLSNYVRPVQP